MCPGRFEEEIHAGWLVSNGIRKSPVSTRMATSVDRDVGHGGSRTFVLQPRPARRVTERGILEKALIREPPRRVY
jgi:hypothetical protein